MSLASQRRRKKKKKKKSRKRQSSRHHPRLLTPVDNFATLCLSAVNACLRSGPRGAFYLADLPVVCACANLKNTNKKSPVWGRARVSDTSTWRGFSPKLFAAHASPSASVGVRLGTSILGPSLPPPPRGKERVCSHEIQRRVCFQRKREGEEREGD